MRGRKQRRVMRNKNGRIMKLASGSDDADEFKYDSNNPLTSKSIPKNVKKLYLENYNHPIYPDVLPRKLKELHLGSPFNQPLNGDLPDTISSLYLGDSFRKILKVGDLPKSLEKLYLGKRHTQIFVPGVIPDGVKVIHFGDGMTGTISPKGLPYGVREIIFGGKFNQPLYPGIFSYGLEILELGEGFNQPISRGVLPNSLKILNLHSGSNNEIETGALPEGIEEISLRCNSFDQIYKLPRSLKKLKIGGGYLLPIQSLPENVVDLTLETYMHPLNRTMFPEGLERLVISEMLLSEVIHDYNLPAFLKELVIGPGFYSSIKSLPSSLVTLIFDCEYYKNNAFDPTIFPRGLKILKIGRDFDHDIPEGSLPGGLEELTLPDFYSGTAILPPSVRQTVPESLIVKSEINTTWVNFTRMVKGFVNSVKTAPIQIPLGELLKMDPSRVTRVPEKLIMELERMYNLGYPIPVEPHEYSLLKTVDLNFEEMNIVRHFVFDRNHHFQYIQQLNKDRRMKKLINNWIYGDYSWFNETVGNVNMGVSYTYENLEFLGGYKDTPQAHIAFHNAIMMAPRVDRKIYAWRGMHGMEDLCMNARVGSYVKFSRFMACSVAQEVSCQVFARGGILLLIELPPNSPFMNLTPFKKSEPEFLLPDRCMFEVVKRIRFNSMKIFCENICEEIVHLRLVGVHDTDWNEFETYLGDDDLSIGVMRKMDVGAIY